MSYIPPIFCGGETLHFICDCASGGLTAHSCSEKSCEYNFSFTLVFRSRYWSQLYIDVEQKWIDMETNEVKERVKNKEWFGNVRVVVAYGLSDVE